MASAHGGWEKNIDNYIVFINQDPIAPLVGEQVKIYLQIMDKEYQPIENLPVSLTLIDTAYNNPAADRTIYNKDFVTDIHGGFNVTYVFDKENYFDVEIAFTDPKTGRKEQTGYLIQPRTVPVYRLVAAVAAAFTAGVLSMFLYRRRKHNQ